MTSTRAAPGWYGKLPSLGDFASRRLGAEFIEPWDAWLAAGLLSLREAAPERWLDDYLGSPSWRFLLMPGVLPGSGAASAWAGVLMPSVDRVGRYFPLTVALPLPEGVGSVQQMTGLWYWLARLDELARDALYEDWTLEQLEDELSRMALPDVAASAPALPARPEAEGAMLAQEPQTDATQAIGAEAHQGWAVQARGLAWWQAKPDDGPARLWLSRGLPASAVLANLFGPAATI